MKKERNQDARAVATWELEVYMGFCFVRTLATATHFIGEIQNGFLEDETNLLAVHNVPHIPHRYNPPRFFMF